MEEFFWKTLLVVGALSASGHCAPPQNLLTYNEAVEQGVANYNKKAKEDFLYHLLEAVPQAEWDPNSKDTQELKFTIKQTVCPAKEGGSLDKCDFKEGGVVRECTATYFLGEKTPVAVLDCKAVEGIKEGEEEVQEKEEEKENQEVGQLARSMRWRRRSRRSIWGREDVKVVYNVNINNGNNNNVQNHININPFRG